MYRPSTDFEGALERYCLGVLPGLGPEALASLVGSAARLQLPLSPQLEDGIITRLEQVCEAHSHPCRSTRHVSPLTLRVQY
jgi:hypothetical protein